eukprot:COSAG05_NODE_4339_length_1559_cov_9.341096_2_plen_233_part_00
MGKRKHKQKRKVNSKSKAIDLTLRLNVELEQGLGFAKRERVKRIRSRKRQNLRQMRNGMGGLTPANLKQPSFFGNTALLTNAAMAAMNNKAYALERQMLDNQSEAKALHQSQLNASAGSSGFLSLTFTVSFDQLTAKFSFDCGLTDLSYSPVEFIFDDSGAHKLFGFVKNSTNAFDQQLGILISTGSISTMFADALLFHSDVLNTNVDRGTGEMSTFHLSDVFAKIPINTSP